MSIQYAVHPRAHVSKKPVYDLSFQQGSYYQPIYPKNVVIENQRTPIIFEWTNFPDMGFNFKDSILEFSLKIVSNTGADIQDGDLIRPVNAIGHTYFKRMELYCNGTPLYSQQTNPIKYILDTMIEKKLNTENMDVYTGYRHIVSTEKDRTDKTKDVFKNTQKMNKWTLFIIKLNIDFFRTGSDIMSLHLGRWELRLIPEDLEKTLNWGIDHTNDASVASSTETDYKIFLKPDITFQLKLDKFSDESIESINSELLSKGHPIKCVYRPSVLKTYTISKNSNREDWHDIFPGISPFALYCTFVSHDGHMGARNKSPFYMHPGNGLKRISVYLNDKLLGQPEALNMDLTDDNNLKKLYYRNMYALNIGPFDEHKYWKYEDLAKGSFIYCVPLSTNPNANGLLPRPELNVISATIEYDPNKPKTENVTCIWYALISPVTADFYQNGRVINNFTQ